VATVIDLQPFAKDFGTLEGLKHLHFKCEVVPLRKEAFNVICGDWRGTNGGHRMSLIYT